MAAEREEELLQRNIGLERVYDFESGYPDLASFLDGFSTSIETEGRGNAHVLFMEGVPGSGKTYLAEIIQLYLERRLINLPVGIAVFNWDTCELEMEKMLDEAKAGSISKEFNATVRGLTPKGRNPDEVEDMLLGTRIVHGEPYPTEFLLATGVLLRRNVNRELRRKGQYKVFIIDKPGGVAIQVGDLDRSFRNKARFREYGLGLLRDLKKRENVHTGYIGLIPGPTMFLLAYARDLIDAARKIGNDQKALECANEIAYAFGLPPFDIDKLRSIPPGGSVRQVKYVQEARNFLINFIKGFLRDETFKHPDRKSLLAEKFERMRVLNLLMTLHEIIRTDSPEKMIEEYKGIAQAYSFPSQIIDQAQEVARTLDEDPLESIQSAMYSLGSALIFELIAYLYADHFLVAYNNPPVRILPREEMRRLVKKYGFAQ